MSIEIKDSFFILTIMQETGSKSEKTIWGLNFWIILRALLMVLIPLWVFIKLLKTVWRFYVIIFIGETESVNFLNIKIGAKIFIAPVIRNYFYNMTLLF